MKALSTILCNQIPPNSTLLKIEYVLALKARTDYMFCAGFFHTKKNFKNFFGFNLANHTCRSLYGAERGIHTFHFIAKGGVILKPSDFQKTIQCQFDCKLKKVVKGIVRNYRKELARRQAKEVSFCELPEIVVEK